MAYPITHFIRAEMNTKIKKSLFVWYIKKGFNIMNCIVHYFFNKKILLSTFCVLVVVVYWFTKMELMVPLSFVPMQEKY